MLTERSSRVVNCHAGNRSSISESDWIHISEFIYIRISIPSLSIRNRSIGKKMKRERKKEEEEGGTERV